MHCGFYVCSLAVPVYEKLQVTGTILFGYIAFDPACQRKIFIDLEVNEASF